MKKDSLNILYEDNDIIVCVKPSGTATQSANIRTPDMVSLVKSHLSSENDGEPYLGLIHRLDQPVSGILVFAKTPSAASNLSRQVQTTDMGKYYTAKVHGMVNGGSEPTLLTDYLIKDGKTNIAKVVSKNLKGPDGKPAKEATLTYTVLSQNADDNISTLRIKLLTGRFHQIRVQLSHMGHPILGDVKYGAEPLAEAEPGKIELSADELHFIHPVTGEKMNFSIL